MESAKFCKENRINSVGGKIDISDRIVEYLETGKFSKTKTTKNMKVPKASEPISQETIIGIIRIHLG